MPRFNIREDLESRALAQKIEILAISGPTAPWVREKLVTQDYTALTARFGFEFPAAVSQAVLSDVRRRYGSLLGL